MASSLLKFAVKTTSHHANVVNAVDKKVDGAYRYLAGAIRRNARRSIKKGSKSKPHSQPGTAVNSRSGIYKNTIERDYNPSTKVLVVGPKTTKGRKVGSKTLPQALEYGVRYTASKPTFIPYKTADIRARKIAFLKRKRTAIGLRQSDMKWVVIPAGPRKIDQRPTLRLAFNKTLTARNLKTAFDRIGISDPSSIRRSI